MRNYFQRQLALSNKGVSDLLQGILFSMLANLSLMIPVGLFAVLLDALLKPLQEKALPTHSLFIQFFFVLLALGVIFTCHYWQYSSVFLATYTESATRRINLAETLRQLPLAFFGKQNLSDLTNSIMGDCTMLEHGFSHAVPQLFGAVLSILIITFGLLFMDWRMGLAALWVVPVAFILIIASKYQQHRVERIHYQAKRTCAEGIQECLETIQDIQSCGMTESYLKQLDQKLANAEQAHIRSELTLGSFVTSAQAMLQLGLVSVVLVGGDLLIHGEITVLAYLVFLIAASRLYNPLSATLSNIAELFLMEIPLQRMRALESQPRQQGQTDFSINNFDIQFQRVAFSYHDNQPVLKDVSFVARQGEITALVGPSGGGKSTAAKLAARFWGPDSGTITLGGQDIRAIDPESLLKYYAVVFQDVTLFNDTIMENIRLGRMTATDDEVRQAARMAMCDDFVSRMPAGYNTVIGENGSTLSGGERQRLSIARAILKNAPIILLDEATASLDVENETKIQAALSELIKDKTVLIIAHRMRTIANADKVIVLSDGYVAQQGNPIHLMNQSGLFRRMVDIQSQNMTWSL